MFHTSYRAANAADLGAMIESRGSLAGNLLRVSLPISAFLFAIVYAISRSILISALIAGVLILASAVSNFRFFKEVRRRQELTSDPQAVEVIEVHATSVLDIEPMGSHSPAFCFFTDGEAMLLMGQWLMEQPSFPSMTFRLHRWSDTKTPIRIESMGPEIDPEQSNVQLRPKLKISDVEVFEARPETLQEDLDRAFGSTNFKF